MTAADTEVLVVGGGVAGVSLVHALSRRRIAATLIDAGAIGEAGASGIPAALLNPNRGRTGRAAGLDLAGLAATRDLSERLEAEGHVSGVHRGGVLRIASSSRQRELWSELVGPISLDPSEFPSHLRAKFGGMLISEGGWLEPKLWLAALANAARGAGAVILEHTELLALPGARELVAETTAGPIAARQVVLCLGAYDAAALRLPRLETAPGLAVTFTLRSAAATQAVATPSATIPSVTIPTAKALPLAGAVGIVFSPAGVVVSGTAHGDTANGDGSQTDIERLRTAAAWFVPALADSTVAGVWRGVRARRPSGVPVMRRLKPGLTLLGGLGGRGFLCSALLAERLTRRLADELAASR